MANPDTSVGAGQSRFPPTAWTLVGQLRDPRDPKVQSYLNRMIQAYWRPVYKYVRLSWKRSNEDAKDLTQAFFVHLLGGELFARADPSRGNFRSLLLSALRHFLSNEARASEAVKRGGHRQVVSLDAGLDALIPDDTKDPQSVFEAQWARDILERSVERLEGKCRPEVFAAFRRFHLEQAPVRQIAAELGTSESQVAHHLQDARSALRRLVTDEIREYVRDEEEVSRELDQLFRGWR